MNRLLTNLTDAHEAKDHLAAELGSTREDMDRLAVELNVAQARRVILDVELDTAKADKEQVVAEQKIAAEAQKNAESRYKKL